MTDKQIIFDDVDVKDCIAYAKSQTIYLGSTIYKQMEKVCLVKNQPCKFFDCQFKQMARELKHKEQECEELKKQYNCYACDTCKGKEDYINLKRHCENAIKSLHNKQAEFDQLKTDREEVLKQFEFVRTFNTVQEAEIRKYSKTLAEIKEIAEEYRISNSYYTPLARKILQKISKCEVENE